MALRLPYQVIVITIDFLKQTTNRALRLIVGITLRIRIVKIRVILCQMDVRHL